MESTDDELTEEDLRLFSTYEVSKMLLLYVAESILGTGLILAEILGQRRNANLHLYAYFILMATTMYDLHQTKKIYNDVRNKVRTLMINDPNKTHAFLNERKKSQNWNIASGAKRLDLLTRERLALEEKRKRESFR